jgi:hypothetical protein
MNDNKRHFTVMIGTKPDVIPVDAVIDRFHTIEQVATDAVRKAGITTHRNKIELVNVKVNELSIANGALVTNQVGSYNITPPFAPMTVKEFDGEMEDALADLPEPFKKFVRDQTHDRGDGYEGRVCIAREMADELEKAIRAHNPGPNHG